MRRSSSRRAPARRRLVWARYQLNSTPVVGGTAFSAFPLDAFETAYGAQILGSTVMRVRGTISAKQTSATSDGRCVVAMKVADLPGVSPESPLTAGINDDWFMYEAFCGVTNVPAAAEPSLQQDRLVDVRSRRKLDELGNRLVLAIEVAGGGAGPQFRVAMVLSILIALP